MAGGGPADHVRCEAVQRRARLRGAAGPRDQPLPKELGLPRKDGFAHGTGEPEPQETLQNEPDRRSTRGTYKTNPPTPPISQTPERTQAAPHAPNTQTNCRAARA